MPQEGKISFLGLANWNEDLFQNMSWPDPFTGVNPILDQDAFLDELYSRTAELEVIYTDPYFMQRMIGAWSKTRLPVWNLLWETTTYEYNPIENYDRIEDGTDTDTNSGTDSTSRSNTHTGSNTDTHTGADTERHSGTDTVGETVSKTGKDTNTNTPLNEHYEAAYDSAAGANSDGLVKTTRDEGETVNETSYGSTDTTNGSQTHGHIITNEHGETITHGYNETEAETGSTVHGHKLTREHDWHIHGNIGTVTTQAMIQEQRNIVTFNFYDVMIRDFIDRFCIMVY